jgi:hypothetical protein
VSGTFSAAAIAAMKVGVGATACLRPTCEPGRILVDELGEHDGNGIDEGIPECLDQVFSLRGGRIEGDVVVSDQEEVVGVGAVTKRGPGWVDVAAALSSFGDDEVEAFALPLGKIQSCLVAGHVDAVQGHGSALPHGRGLRLGNGRLGSSTRSALLRIADPSSGRRRLVCHFPTLTSPGLP